ncbi:hypothetical protein SMICM304S_04312 [Streptomyces microflavus]
MSVMRHTPHARRRLAARDRHSHRGSRRARHRRPPSSDQNIAPPRPLSRKYEVLARSTCGSSYVHSEVPSKSQAWPFFVSRWILYVPDAASFFRTL